MSAPPKPDSHAALSSEPTRKLRVFSRAAQAIIADASPAQSGAGLQAGQTGQSRLPPAPPPNEPVVDFLWIFRIIRRRWMLILTLALGLIMLAVPFIWTMERVFTAELRLLLNRPTTIALATPNADKAMGLDLSTELERLLAKANVVQVIDDLGLADLPEFSPRTPRELANVQDSVTTKFYEGLSIRRESQTNVVRIGFRSLDPELAALIPNALVGVYLHQRAEMLRAQVKQANDWMQDQIEAEKRNIAEMEAKQSAYLLAHGPLSAEFQMAEVYQISTLDARGFAIAQSQSELERRMSRLKRGTLEIGNGETSTMAAHLLRELQAKKLEHAKLMTTYGENHAGTIAAQEAFAETQAAVAREVQLQIDQTISDLAAIESERAVLLAQQTKHRENLFKMGVAQAEVAVMERAITTRRETLARLEDQIRTLATEGALPPAEVEILSPASIPVGPTGRGRKFYFALATAAAFCLALSLVAGLDLADRSLRSQQHLRDIPGVYPAGLIPRVVLHKSLPLASQLSQGRDGAFDQALRWVMMMLREDRNRTQQSAAPTSLLVTSALPNEGKSLVSVALAAAYQASGQAALLVDCDLLLGQVHRQFSPQSAQPAPEPGLGLVEALAGLSSWSEVMRLDPATGIAYITRGESKAKPDWARLEDLRRFAAERHLLLILDGAPVLASAETVGLRRLVDQTLMVAAWGRSTRRSLTLALERLREEDRHEILVAINDVDRLRHGRYGFEDSGIFDPALTPYFRRT